MSARHSHLFSLVLIAACTATTPRRPPSVAMTPSDDVRDTVLRFYQKMRTSDMTGFDELISNDPSLMVIGSANEWITKRDSLRGVFRLKNQGLEAGPNPAGYENGDFGWFVDQPDWVFSDGSRMHTRFTVILQKEAGSWKLLHWHLSVGVPDDEAVDLQRRSSLK
jgi:ketosteroid isomerase-like protein